MTREDYKFENMELISILLLKFQRGRHLLQTDVSLSLGSVMLTCFTLRYFNTQNVKTALQTNSTKGSSYWQKNTCIEYMHRRAEDRGGNFLRFHSIIRISKYRF